jgi:predicted trehalose synthase
MNFFKTIARLLGFAQREYHHIVDGFNKAVVDLEALAEREKQKAADAIRAMKEHEQKLGDATQASHQALTTAGNIKNLLGN